MTDSYAPGEHPAQQEYMRENPTREQIIGMLDTYDQNRVMPFVAGLDERLQWLETPLWRRAWIVTRGRLRNVWVEMFGEVNEGGEDV